ncbi:hypothetical protein [Novosphingobium sp. FKTRR1]|uniref:phage adaptor protein n=1 Tax=Novosphingobium sp. FKTRR1 TaxID=2879118 RepID=UPI001CF0C8F1|nr:hypothetical protein [Novosphingobium sp. FKTRR1]
MLERESGTIQQGSRLTTVVGALGRQEKMVNWIAEAWRMVQTGRSDWPFMAGEFEGTINAGAARMTAAALGIANFAGWGRRSTLYQPFTIYDPAIGRSSEQELQMIPWQQYKMRWDRAVHTPLRPCEVSFDQQQRICFGPTSDGTYTVRGEYRRAPQILSVDTDVPILPEQHHEIIVWRAVMLMGDHDEAPAVVQTGTAKYQRALRDLVDDIMEEVTL